MDKDELIQLLGKHEWSDVEFKKSQRQASKSAYETVSAFANTEGGHLVFGVDKHGLQFEIVGVIDVDTVQNDFISSIRDTNKLSVILDVDEDLFQYEGHDILVFYIPEAKRSEKPVYFTEGRRKKAFVRIGGSDCQLSDDELKRFIIDSHPERFETKTYDFPLEETYDQDTLKWYRGVYENRAGNRSCAHLDDLDFLSEMGLLDENTGTRKATYASILLFGTNSKFRQVHPGMVVDCQTFDRSLDDVGAEGRWIDRYAGDENLLRCWQGMINWYQKFSNHSFSVDSATMIRDDNPPDYLAYRESMINLLIHQDYSDHSRKAEITRYKDQTRFWNPGDAFAPNDKLLEPGEKEVRNPKIVSMFRRIGLSENAGWGLRDIYKSWQQLGNVLPEIDNDKAHKNFRLTLKSEILLSEEQMLFQAKIGLRLSQDQARLFAQACREGGFDVAKAKVLLGVGADQVLKEAAHLVTQEVIDEKEPGVYWALKDHLKDCFSKENEEVSSEEDDQSLVSDQVDDNEPNLVSDQVELNLKKLSEKHWQVLSALEVPHRLEDLLNKLEMSNKTYFRRTYLNPLMKLNLIQMTIPDAKRAPNQKYVITESGLQLLEEHRKSEE